MAGVAHNPQRAFLVGQSYCDHKRTAWPLPNPVRDRASLVLLFELATASKSGENGPSLSSELTRSDNAFKILLNQRNHSLHQLRRHSAHLGWGLSQVRSNHRAKVANPHLHLYKNRLSPPRTRTPVGTPSAPAWSEPDHQS
ncbi:hypothetical protein QYF36_013384 [Acer negundo]|nr:hypothetical protein QYF36_013384 [Acer negundo]